MQSEQYIRVDYTRAEIMTDAVVHAIGFSAALIAVPTLVVLAALWFHDATVVAASAIYGVSVLAMFVCSAIYNIFSPPEWKDTFRRLDQSAIYLKIAGSYTPFAVLAGSGSLLLLTLVWITAALGTGLIVFSPRRMRWLSLSLSGARLGGRARRSPDAAGHVLDRRRSHHAGRDGLYRGPLLLSLGPAAVPQHDLARFCRRRHRYHLCCCFRGAFRPRRLRLKPHGAPASLRRTPAARSCALAPLPVLHMQQGGGCAHENYRPREAGD